MGLFAMRGSLMWVHADRIASAQRADAGAARSDDFEGFVFGITAKFSIVFRKINT
jgi:hypothetical protein